MKPITKETFNDVLNSKKAIVFFHKDGCGNCESMFPLLENIAIENKDINVFSYHCESKPDEISGKYQFKVFPGVFSFVDGKSVRGMSGMKSIKQLMFLFTHINDMKIMQYDMQSEADFMKKEISEYNVGTQIIEDKIDPLDAPLPDVLDKKKEDCTSCEA